MSGGTLLCLHFNAVLVWCRFNEEARLTGIVRQVDELMAHHCRLTDEKVAQIGFQQMDVSKIDFRNTHKITAVGWATIGIDKGVGLPRMPGNLRKSKQKANIERGGVGDAVYRS